MSARRLIAAFVCLVVILGEMPFVFWGNDSAHAGVITQEKTETYYHLDLGVQVVERYGDGTWYNGVEYGKYHPGVLTYSLTINREPGGVFELVNVYPYKNFPGEIPLDEMSRVSHNMTIVTKNDFENKYMQYTSTDMRVKGFSANGRDVTFSYEALMDTVSNIELYSYAETGGEENMIYSFFNSKEELYAEYPKIYNSVYTALTDGASGAYGARRCYLVFCPTVIEYTITTEETINIGDVRAELDLPAEAKQNSEYSVRDVSIVDSYCQVDYAVLEKSVDSGEFKLLKTWPGPGEKGKNTGMEILESSAEIGAVTYRLTVYTTTGQSDVDEKTIIIKDGRTVAGAASLSLPSETYEGHQVMAEDKSTFKVDGTNYSAFRAYKEGVASNYFEILEQGGHITKDRTDPTLAWAVFDNIGKYTVSLFVNLLTGQELKDSKNITVKKTPEIQAELSGVQKQNRKQLLSVKIAQNPRYKITDWQIKLTDENTGENVILSNTVLQSNSDNIKTRPVNVRNTEEFVFLELEFLTKLPVYEEANPNKKGMYSYEIYARDSRGVDCTRQDVFEVLPDKPPVAEITVENAFIRNQGSNTASVMVEDTSRTDGDQLSRIWEYQVENPRDFSKGPWIEIGTETPGYTDKSYGSGQKVAFDKSGVGKVYIRLTVKDVWTEETLEEYVKPEDYLTGMTTAITEVVNVAPIVDIKPIRYSESEILFIARKADDMAQIMKLKQNLKSDLLASGIRSNVEEHQIKVLPGELWSESQAEEMWVLRYLRMNRGDKVSSFSDATIEDDLFYCMDQDTVYMMRPTYVLATPGKTYYHYYVEQPITISAYEVSDTTQQGGEPEKLKWQTTVTKDILDIDFAARDLSNHFVLDQTDKYLFLLGESETLIINKENGAFVANIPKVIGDDVFCIDDMIYYVDKSGLWCVDQNLNLNKIFDGTVPIKNAFTSVGGSAMLIDGNIHFMTSIKGNPVRVVYNPKTFRTEMRGFYGEVLAGTNLTIVGFGQDGAVTFGQTESLKTVVYSVDMNNKVQRKIEGIPAGGPNTLCVYKKDGTYDYIVSVINSGTNFSQVRGYGVKNDKTFTYSSVAKEDAYEVDAKRIMYAYQLNEEEFYLISATWSGTSYDGTLGMSAMGYYSYGSKVKFDINSQSVSRSNAPYMSGFLSDFYRSTSTHRNTTAVPYESNTALNIVINMPNQKMDEVMYKTIGKKSTQGNEKSALIIYDTESFETDNMEMTARLLSEKTTDIFIKAGQSIKSYTEVLAEGLRNLGKNVYSFTTDIELGEKLKSVFGNDSREEKHFMIETANGAYIEREITLLPGKKYYYEYEIETEADKGSIETTFTQEIETKNDDYIIKDKQYEVIKEIKEDFGDIDVQPGLTINENRIDGGRYRIVHYIGSGNKYGFAPSGTMGFSIPKGCKGVLSFDYIVDDTWDDEDLCFFIVDSAGNERILDDRRVVASRAARQWNSYTHSEALDEGNYVLKAVMRTHGYSSKGRMEIGASIDNFSILIVKPAEETIPAYQYGLWQERLGTAEKTAIDKDIGIFSGSVETMPGVAFLREHDSLVFNEEIMPDEAVQVLAEYVFDETTAENGGCGYTFIVPEDNIYQIEGFGPASDSAGGIVKGFLYLKKGQKIDIWTGEGVKKATKLIDGQDGENGGGYNNMGTLSYSDLKALCDEGSRSTAVYIDGELVLVAGGGASDGNNNGYNSTVESYRSRYIYNKDYFNCQLCGYYCSYASSAGFHRHYNHYKVAIGGTAGIGGNTVETVGTKGQIKNTLLSSDIADGRWGQLENSNYYYASETAGNGGTGGASWINEELLKKKQWLAGGNAGNGKVTIRILPIMTKEESQKTNVQGSIDRYYYNIPNNYMSLFTSVDSESYGNLPVYFTIDDKSYTRYPGSVYVNNTADEKMKIISKGIKGYREFTLSNYAETKSVAIGKYTNIESFLSATTGEAIESGKYIVDDFNGDGKKEVLLKDGYAGNTVKMRISLPSNSICYLKRFDIYTYVDGKKVYIEKGSIGKKKMENWTVKNATAKLCELPTSVQKTNLKSPIYKKGEKVEYEIYYSDYENDPSKKQGWIYVQTPFTDGENPDAAVILDENDCVINVCGEYVTPGALRVEEAVERAFELGSKTHTSPIERFYIDGKYKVFHYQYDNTSKGLYPDGFYAYDKVSNFADVTFYIDGLAANAPYIERIAISPAVPKENEKISIHVNVDDLEKDILSLVTEVYRDGSLIYTHRKKDIEAVADIYPVINTDSFVGIPGAYTVVCTVRDDTGVGMDSYEFNVVSLGKIEGNVNHTDEWDRRRKEYNLHYFGNEINEEVLFSHYINEKNPRKRGVNVFWTGEKFVLLAKAASNPIRVECILTDDKGKNYRTELINTGKKDEKNQWIYSGELWSNDFINKWGKRTPEEVTFNFLAYYKGDIEKNHEVKVIIDETDAYLKHHRKY